MRFAIRWAVVLLLGMSVSVAVAQEDESEKLAQRITRLEGFKEIIDGKFNNEAQKLELKFEKYKKEADDKIQQADDRAKELDLSWKKKEFELSQNYRHIENITWTLGTVSLVGLFLLVVSAWTSLYNLINKKVPEIAEAKANEKFEKYFNDNSEKLIRLIQQYNEETQLKQKKSVVVLSHSGSDIAFMENFFKRMDFAIPLCDIFDLSKKYVDKNLIFFNDEDGRLNEQDIIDYAKEVPETTICFYFGKKRINVKELGENFTFANNKMQLYGNLMNALRYQSMLGG